MECIELVNKIQETNITNQPIVLFLIGGLIFMGGIMFEMCRISESTHNKKDIWVRAKYSKGDISCLVKKKLLFGYL